MNLVLFCVAWLIGGGAGAFLLVQALIVLFFGVPFSLRLKSLGILRGNGPLPAYVASLVLLPSVFAVVTYAIYSWLPKQVVGYWVGVGIPVLLGLGKYGATSVNVQEYIETNAASLDMDRLREHLGSTMPTAGGSSRN